MDLANQRSLTRLEEQVLIQGFEYTYELAWNSLREELIKNIQRIFSHYPVIEKAILYGSRARGNYKPGSDIDLTLIGKRLDNAILNKISCELDDLLSPYAFDISIYHSISNEDLLEHIESVGVSLYILNKTLKINSSY